jgi:hypothetical protein
MPKARADKPFAFARVCIFVPLYIGRSLIIFPARNSASKSNTRITNGALRNSQLISINHILRLYSQHTHTYILTHCFKVQNAQRKMWTLYSIKNKQCRVETVYWAINWCFCFDETMLLPWVK